MGDSASKSDFSHASSTSSSSSRSPSKSTPPKPIIYTGRFAPSPTGPIHFGSLVAATASYLCAREKNGRWLLRMEDVDTQRERQGASQSIIQTLDDYGFEWHGEIRFQSQHSDNYEEALAQLIEHTFYCTCTRKFLLENASTGKYGYIYPGYCRNNALEKNIDKWGGVPSSIRIRTDIHHEGSHLDFEELCQEKHFTQNLEQEVGDFIIKRRDGLFAYQLAVVVDDELQGVTDIVRGADLFDNTPRQRYLQNLLGYHQPGYLHFPVAVDALGNKLSKHNLSPEISSDEKRATLIQALDFLGQNPPSVNDFSTMDDLWKWAVQNWDISKIPKTLTKVI